MEQLNQYLNFTPEVMEAVASKKPVVALETTIISHGMPYPLNLKTAREVEYIIRKAGAVPATIGILNGKIMIGLTSAELDYFARADDIIKTSRRDLPYIIANKLNGATTVAGTMICAEMAGIKVFVTGGIGGVHRGVEKTWDISADLQELMNTSVAVICSGVKSILDIKKTLEYLETSGVPVIGYKTADFPAFFTRKSGSKVDFVVSNAEEAAAFLFTKWSLNLKGGVVVASPVPEKDAMDEGLVDQAIEDALALAARQNIQGKEITPFLLAKIKEITEGRSLEANVALIKNNAFAGAEIAIALQELINKIKS
jgi:pseudouridine-5'-phosphate glycosidase